MAEIFLSYLTLYGLNSNIVMANGAGVLEFQREKMYPSFRYISTLLLIMGIILCGLITYLLQAYVYSAYQIEYISVSVLVLLAGAYNLIISKIWRKVSSFDFYLYESSFSFAFDLVYIVFVVITLDMSVKISYFLLELLAVSLIIFITNIILGFFVKSMNRGYMNINFRNVPARLYFFALILIILTFASKLVI